MLIDSSSQFPRRHEDAISTLLPDGFVVIMKLGSTVGYTLTPLSALLWEFSDGKMSLAEIVAEVERLVGDQLTEASDIGPELFRVAEDLIASNYLIDTDSSDATADD